MHVLNK